MKKMNKKGFTLIEMLVVIAIIAILVAIIIPTVTNSTTKASAAANAANLRSLKAEITTQLLISEDTFTASGVTCTKPATAGADWTVVTSGSTITFKDLATVTPVTGTFDATKNLEVTIAANNTVTVKYDGLSITDWAKLAE